ncbi:sensor histidine kinase [Candidatus Nitrosotenuis aquarius]|uniref:sensor histidine kinase n=1 Tax=Candidatus Nitrosotenuis aquarius TaxID=1846278 RepID=UPI000C1E871C|nr:ATP-binding protein [Candidatus Nitrosotenuis aquarius]
MHPRKAPRETEVDRLLRNAQEDAERLLRHAKEDAERLLKNSQEDAERLLRHAREDVGRLAQDQGAEETIPPNVSIKKDKLYTIGEMSSRLAHDLQNPLTIIKNTIELLNLKNPNLDKKTKESYDRIERAANKMSQQIHDVLDYVRTSNLVMEKTSILTLLKDTISGLSIPTNAKIILPDQNVDIYGDVKQLEIVFSNLILNAVQARDDGGRVMIQASEIDDYTIIDVIDNGRGIEKEHLPRIFEPLFTTKPGGTGLGLASCKSIIENHGGTIECSSIVNKGTVFTIRLPRY